MSTAITLAGETLIAQKHISGEALVIDRIILANIPDLDLAQPVDRAQGKPAQNRIVYDYVIPDDYKGFVNPNQVVYSMLLGSDIGNFQFNWLGLYSSEDQMLIAVTQLPLTDKWQTDTTTNRLGNNLTRNFLLQFSGAKAVTNITVEAKTWQVDFTARLRSIDERERLSNRDIYGRSCFFNDGFKVVKSGSYYVLKAGAGYVEGIRCVLKADTPLTVSALPKNVFLDVSLQQQGSDVVPVITPQLGSNWIDYTDGNNVRHYCIKVAEISAAGVVKDVRRTEAVTSDLVEYLKRRTDNHANRKDDPHNTVAKVKALLSSSITNASAIMIATPLAVKTVYDHLLTHKNANDPHRVVAKVKALLSSSISNASSTTFATPLAVKTVNDHLNTHKAANDPHGVVAKVKALLTSSVTSTSTTMFATPKAVKTVRDLIVGHMNSTGDVHELLPQGGSVGDCLKKDANGLIWGTAGLTVADFLSSKNVTGWQKLPSGIILQWGEVTNVSLNQIYNAITFPISFPHAALNVSSMVSRDSTISGTVSLVAKQLTQSGVKIAGDYDTNKSTGNIYWFAIGY